jgi:3-hydroxyisobutyrate dehydrogenase-like beta-hydroxyacid dehydrogenase
MRMAARSKGKVGVVGLGTMGGAYARHLAAAGWSVTGFDIAVPRKRAAARAGVAIAADARALAEAAPTIIMSLPSAEALDMTVAAITREKLAPRTVVETSTLKLADKQRAERTLRGAGHVMLDCPVSGTGAQAAVKDIVVYASGDTQAIARSRRVLADFSRATYDVGAFGNGSRMKYVANLLVTIHNVASAEAIVLGMKSGLDPQLVYDLIRAGVGKSRIFELRGPMMVRNEYDDVTMSVKLYHKDISVIEDHASTLGVPTPLFSASIPIYSSAMALGYGQQDTASVCAVLQTMAGIKRSKTKRRGKKRNGRGGR